MASRLIATAAAVSLVVAWATTSIADVGPKPTMSFAFSLGQNLTISKGALLMCQDEKCGDPHPLEPLGPQRFTCDPQSCHAMAYGFAPFGMIEITLSDGRTLRSNVFGRGSFNAKFRVAVVGTGLSVQPEP